MTKQYEKRDAAYDDWLNDQALLGDFTLEDLREAFNAGWAARKQAQYETMMESSKNTKDDA